jgi:hypothetical protein
MMEPREALMRVILGAGGFDEGNRGADGYGDNNLRR